MLSGDMFGWLRRACSGGPKPDSGFAPTSRDEFEYRVDGRRLLIYAELQDGYRLIDVGSLERWEPPHDGSVLTSEEKAQIRKGFEEYLKSRGVVFSWSDQ